MGNELADEILLEIDMELNGHNTLPSDAQDASDLYLAGFWRMICSSAYSMRSAMSRMTSLTVVFIGRYNLNRHSWRRLSRLQTSNSWRFSLLLEEVNSIDEKRFLHDSGRTERNLRWSSTDSHHWSDWCRESEWSVIYPKDSIREHGSMRDRRSKLWLVHIDAFDCVLAQLCER